MRQVLVRPDGIANYAGYLDRVREDLAAQYPEGEFRVIGAHAMDCRGPIHN